jgi:hypothetical protein
MGIKPILAVGISPKNDHIFYSLDLTGMVDKINGENSTESLGDSLIGKDSSKRYTKYTKE